jgi:adenylate cyclase class IV
MKKPVEIEFKYRADNISLTAFTEFCKSRRPIQVIHAAGYDHFYQHAQEGDSFCRHRIGPDMNQLTFKRKTTDSNNFVRTEHNLDLDSVTQEQVAALCAEFGYKPNFSLYKSCFVYNYDCYTLVYYICYDVDMKELGRFVEIEMKEDHPWESETQAWDQLLVFEKLCKPLGVSPQSRVKRSLFELYKK